MRLTRKGDLALSTNAIVVLIIAVIVLGLIIAFITTGFSGVSKKFREQVESMENPVSPTGSKPISFGELVVSSPGAPFGLKIAIMNTYSSAVVEEQPEVFPLITCKKGEVNYINDAETQVTPRVIPARGVMTFTYLSQLTDTTTLGQKLCSVEVAYEDIDGNIVVVTGSPKADLVFMVEE